MNWSDRVLLTISGAALLVTLIEAVRRGFRPSKFRAHDPDDHPIRSAVATLAEVAIIVSCAFVAAGFNLRQVWQAIWLT